MQLQIVLQDEKNLLNFDWNEKSFRRDRQDPNFQTEGCYNEHNSISFVHALTLSRSYALKG